MHIGGHELRDLRPSERAVQPIEAQGNCGFDDEMNLCRPVICSDKWASVADRIGKNSPARETRQQIKMAHDWIREPCEVKL